ncbi:MAG: hypothetical protein AAF581_16525 [Planctomycetota bacterium]
MLLHNAQFMSNHPHLDVTDVHGDTLPLFMRDFFSLLARSTNCYWGRWENFWDNGRPHVLHVAPTAQDVIGRLSYTVSNVVEAGLVSHAKKWQGVRVLPQEIGRRKFVVERPKFFYNPKGSMPEFVTIETTLPRVVDMDPEELRLELSRECNFREERKREEYRREGKKFLGMKRVRRQSPKASPTTREPRRGKVPHVACKDPVLRRKFLAWRKERDRKYEERRQALKDGDLNVEFPQGTFALCIGVGHPREAWGGERLWDRLMNAP